MLGACAVSLGGVPASGVAQASSKRPQSSSMAIVDLMVGFSDFGERRFVPSI
jgi:hypothetical protein